MSVERPLFSGEVSGVHRLELVPESAEARDVREAREVREVREARDARRPLDLPGRTPPAPALGDAVPTDLNAPEL
jgi:hypothetical protein